jgi:hypothetical protein
VALNWLASAVVRGSEAAAAQAVKARIPVKTKPRIGYENFKVFIRVSL